MKKRALAGTLIAVMALSAGLSFADTADTETKTLGTRLENRMDRSDAREDDRGEKMQEIIDTYYPEVSDTWSDLNEDLKSVHDQIRDLVAPDKGERPEMPDFDNMTDDEIEALKTQLFDRMKAAFEAREDGTASDDESGRGPRGHEGIFGAGPDQAQSDLTDEEKAALKEERDAEREARKEARDAFLQAVEDEDEDAIVDYVDSLIDELEQRLEDAQERLETIQSEQE